VNDPEQLASALDDIAEQLDELAFDRLRVAAADGETERPRTDKRLTQARRAVEKAAHILRDLD
jgi:hypothetical protein